MKEALFYDTEKNLVTCRLCPHNCTINPGKKGICRVRRNENGKLIAENYGQFSSIGFDPIEKKPLYHFYPGSAIFSIGSIGCNPHCKFCQNWEISQSGCDDFEYMHSALPEKVIKMALQRKDNIGIAYTYNEPTIWFEYMLDIARLAKPAGLKNVMVSNGFINPEPLKELIPLMDAFSIDLKAFSDDFYHQLTGSHLQPVLDSLKQIRDSDKHLEITNLVITNQNDDIRGFEAMIDWIVRTLGKDTVLHISRYYPSYRLDDPSTPESTLMEFYKMASSKLDFVYIGNIRSNQGQDTYCPYCKTKLIERAGYFTSIRELDSEGKCNHCKNKIIVNL